MRTKLHALITLSIVLLCVAKNHAQLPEWQWAKRVGGPGIETGNSIITDVSGNIYVAGNYYSSSVSFGAITLESSASSSVFLVKYDPSGNVIWAFTSEGTGNGDVSSLAIDAEGSIFMGGIFGSLSFILGPTTLVSQGSDDAFLAKFNADGSVAWATSAGNSGTDRILGITTDSQGNVYATGNFSSTSIIFGSSALENLGSSGLDAFLVKYDGVGNVLWAFRIAGNGADWARAVAVDGNDNVVVTGEHQSEILSLGSVNLTNEEGVDVFIAKFDSNGNALWAKSGNALTSTCQSIAIDANDAIYITGSFYNDSIVFDNITLNNTGQVSYSEFFIAKFDASGNIEWARSSNGDEQEEGRAIAIDAAGDICVAGFFISPTATFGNTTFENAGLEDSFVAKYTSDGNMTWAIAIGAAYADYIQAMTTDGFGNIYTTGFFEGALDFGDHEIYGSNSGWDFFIARLSDGPNSIHEAATSSLNVYPNPTSDKIRIDGKSIAPNASYVIYNNGGQIVLHGNLTALNIDISSLPGGIYALNIAKQPTKRFVVR